MVTYSCSDCMVTCSDHMVTCSCSDCIKKCSYLFHGDMFLFRLHGDIFMFHGDMFMFRLHCDLFTLWCHLHHFIQRDQTACHCPTYTHTTIHYSTLFLHIISTRLWGLVVNWLLQGGVSVPLILKDMLVYNAITPCVIF